MNRLHSFLPSTGRLALSAALCCGLTYTAAHLQAEEAPATDLFGQQVEAPKNKDQQRPIKKDGAEKGDQLNALFKKLDANGDGTLSNDEFASLQSAQQELVQAKRAEHEAALVAEYDSDGDGKISTEERRQAEKDKNAQRLKEHFNSLKENNPERFAEMDSNKDGKLDDDEINAVRVAMRSKMSERLKKDHPDQFAKLDSNNDGELDEEEIPKFRGIKNRNNDKANKNKQRGQGLQRNNKNTDRQKNKRE